MGKVLQNCLPVLTDGFGGENNHYGNDIVGKGASYNVLDYIVAFADGTIVESVTNVAGFAGGGSYGNYCLIDHGNGYKTRYAHMGFNTTTYWLGKKVTKGEVLGYMGSTGTSYGGHLHFEVIKDGTRIDPYPFVFEGKEFVFITIPKPVNENKDVDQVKVICGINTLNLRTSASVNGQWFGQAMPGIYNIISTAEADGYIWYQVEAGKWFANAPGCTEFIKKYIEPVVEEPVEEQPIDNGPKEPQEQPIEDGQANTPTDTETTYSGTNNEEKKHNTIIGIVLFILKEIIKLFKGGK